MSKIQKFETQWAGKPLIIETGRYAAQAGGACTVQYGETVVMATATMGGKREGISWFPLMVDYEEKLYAAGRIKGSRFIKKEGRPTDEAILIGRSIDRGIRPLFDQEMRNEVQVIVTTLAFDGENDPDIPGIIGASCALHMSNIPWNGPLAAVRVGMIDGEYVVNPTYEERENSEMDLAFSGTTDKVLMVEADAKESSEEAVVGGFALGCQNMKEPMELIEKVRQAVGVEKADVTSPTNDEEAAAKEARERATELAEPFVAEKTKEYFFKAPKATKMERRAAMKQVEEELEAFLAQKEIDEVAIGYALNKVYEMIEAEVSRAIVEDGKRVDGRKMTEIRELIVDPGVLPRVHGSGHFSRGETQVLSVVTLGSPGDEQTLDGMETIGTKRYMHHYNFPPFSVGEAKPMRGPGRRDIGHGALAEKALQPMIPNKEEFPYTVRVVSEVMASNGSSSMASTCGSTIALMDAGVPIKKPVAGIAMGLAMGGNGDWKVLTDLQDLEDGPGGMDFKITGTRDGITAIQMDTKTHGLSQDIVEATFAQAKDARMEILKKIEKVLPEPRKELSEHAPRIISININPDKIRDIIGPGGKMINEIIDTTGVQAIDIEDDGLVMITSTDKASADKALEWINNLTEEVEVGKTYKGKVVRLMDFGAFVEVLPNQDGLVHISELAPWHVGKVTDIVNLGDTVFVKVTEIDDQGRTNLSMKQAEGNVYPEKPAGAQDRGGDRRGDRGNGGRGRFNKFRKKN